MKNYFLEEIYIYFDDGGTGDTGLVVAEWCSNFQFICIYIYTCTLYAAPYTAS